MRPEWLGKLKNSPHRVLNPQYIRVHSIYCKLYEVCLCAACLKGTVNLTASVPCKMTFKLLYISDCTEHFYVFSGIRPSTVSRIGTNLLGETAGCSFIVKRLYRSGMFSHILVPIYLPNYSVTLVKALKIRHVLPHFGTYLPTELQWHSWRPWRSGMFSYILVPTELQCDTPEGPEDQACSPTF
jgi:hypothetical protein